MRDASPARPSTGRPYVFPRGAAAIVREAVGGGRGRRADGLPHELYRDWQLSGDHAMLETVSHRQEGARFCWMPGGWDGNQDGVMEGCQHNTLDVEYYGPNPQM